jgi:hypothetical protein
MLVPLMVHNTMQTVNPNIKNYQETVKRQETEPYSPVSGECICGSVLRHTWQDDFILWSCVSNVLYFCFMLFFYYFFLIVCPLIPEHKERVADGSLTHLNTTQLIASRGIKLPYLFPTKTTLNCDSLISHLMLQIKLYSNYKAQHIFTFSHDLYEISRS